jgi:hypothetical protein
VLVRAPYERAAALRPRANPEEILELHWYRSEADYEAARARPTAQVHGMELEEPFPGVVVQPGTRRWSSTTRLVSRSFRFPSVRRLAGFGRRRQ